MCHGTGGNRIENIMRAGNVYRDTLNLSAAFHKVKIGLKIGYTLDIFGVISVFITLAKSDDLLVKARCFNRSHSVFIITVYNKDIRCIVAELGERRSQVIHRLEKVKVVRVNVQYYRNVGEQV